MIFVVVALAVVVVALAVVALVISASPMLATARQTYRQTVVDAPMVQLAGPGLSVRSAAKAWVLPTVREAMLRAGAVAAAAGAAIRVLDASIAGGGQFGAHLSHHRGRDVDVRYLPEPLLHEVLRAAAPAKIYVSRDRVDPLRAAGFPAAFWPGHVDHAHLRW